MFLKPAMVTIAACILLTRARAPEMQAENINRLSCILWTVIGPSIAVESSSHWAIIVFNFFFNLLRSCVYFFFNFWNSDYDLCLCLNHCCIPEKML